MKPQANTHLSLAISPVSLPKVNTAAVEFHVH
jgi:hypothetical protein